MPQASGSRSADAVARVQRLTGVLQPVIEGQGLDLEQVTVTAAGRRSVVRVVVDGDGGVDLDAVAAVSRAASEALDDEPALTGPYVLEVTSPGVDRPLTKRRHWRRAAGRLVTVPVNGEPLTGRIVQAADPGVTLAIDGENRVIAWDSLGPGRVRIEFTRPDRAAASSSVEG